MQRKHSHTRPVPPTITMACKYWATCASPMSGQECNQAGGKPPNLGFSTKSTALAWGPGDTNRHANILSKGQCRQALKARCNATLRLPLLFPTAPQEKQTQSMHWADGAFTCHATGYLTGMLVRNFPNIPE